MTFIDEKQQKNFFDIEKNQYNIKLLIKSKYHTFLELKNIFDRVSYIYKNEPIIDFGSGTGRVAMFLLNKGYKINAVDISKKSLDNLKKVSSSLKLKQLQTFTAIPKGKKFKAIIGADILHHIDIDFYLPKFFDSLSKRGKVVFSEPGAFNLSWYLYLSIFYDWKVEKGLVQCSYFNLINKFKKYRFKKIKIVGLGLFPRPFFNWSKTLCQLNDYLGNLPILKLFAYRYIIEAIKSS